VGFGFDVLPWEKKGLEIIGIAPLSPAEKAGLKVGDLIVRVNGISFRELSEETAPRLQKRLEQLRGTQITVEFERAGEPRPRTVQINGKRTHVEVR
jgi:C-terminal processing protease CtpA/Prc